MLIVQRIINYPLQTFHRSGNVSDNPDSYPDNLVPEALDETAGMQLVELVKYNRQYICKRWHVIDES